MTFCRVPENSEFLLSRTRRSRADCWRECTSKSFTLMTGGIWSSSSFSRAISRLYPHLTHTLLQLPRHTADNMTENSVLISAVQALAQAKQCTPSQICLAWLLAQGSDIIPLVGTKTTSRITENAMSVTVALTAQEIEQLSALPRFKVLQRVRCLFSSSQFITRLQGLRYPEDVHALSYNARLSSE